MSLCDIYMGDIEVDVTEINSCPMHRIGGRRKLSDFAPDGLCVHAFHMAHPYVFTLRNKGWFRWVKDGEGVIAQCPHPRGVVMEIKPAEGNESTVLIKLIDGRECPKHKAGESFEVRESSRHCPILFDVAYGRALKLEREEKLFCPNARGVVFKLRRTE